MPKPAVVPATESAGKIVTQPDATLSGPLRVLAALRQMRFTLTLVLVMVALGTMTGTLFTSAATLPGYEEIATGLPAFAEGRWQTLLTSPLFMDPPLQLLLIAPLVIVGVGWAELKFGLWRTVILFFAGHIASVLLSAGVLLLITPSGWHWAERLAETRDLGPSAGAFTCLAFALATLPAPWRLRARFALAVWAAIELLYIGQLANLEHAIAIALGLAVSGLLPAFRQRAGTLSTREWRLIAFAGLLVIGTVQIIDLVIPYDGPIGVNQPIASLIDVAIDVGIIVLIANGIRQGIRIAWIVTLVLAGFNILTAVLGFALIPSLLESGDIQHPSQVLGLVLPTGVLWLIQLVVLITAHGAFRVPLRRVRRAEAMKGVDRDAAIAQLRRHGGGTISWMITWPPNQYLPTADGIIGFQTHSGVAIALGDPVVAPGRENEALTASARRTERAGLIPCVFSAGEMSAESRPVGWRSVIVAEDTIVDLPGLELTGKRWQPVRTSVNRAAREGIEFRMCKLSEEPFSVLAQVRAISEQWSGEKGLPEMRFTLGTVEEALDPEARVGIAVDADGSLHGITSWLPIYGEPQVDSAAHPAEPVVPRVVGWTLDLMRRRDGGFGPVMEFLIASSALQFAEEGYEFVSLSGAPLVRPETAQAGPVDRLLDRLGELIEPLYGFRSLHKFKQKFNPRSASLHLLYRDEGDLPRIALALTRAYLPDATLRDLVSSATSAGSSRET